MVCPVSVVVATTTRRRSARDASRYGLFNRCRPNKCQISIRTILPRRRRVSVFFSTGWKQLFLVFYAICWKGMVPAGATDVATIASSAENSQYMFLTIRFSLWFSTLQPQIPVSTQSPYQDPYDSVWNNVTAWSTPLSWVNTSVLNSSFSPEGAATWIRQGVLQALLPVLCGQPDLSLLTIPLASTSGNTATNAPNASNSNGTIDLLENACLLPQQQSSQTDSSGGRRDLHGRSVQSLDINNATAIGDSTVLLNLPRVRVQMQQSPFHTLEQEQKLQQQNNPLIWTVWTVRYPLYQIGQLFVDEAVQNQPSLSSSASSADLAAQTALLTASLAAMKTVVQLSLDLDIMNGAFDANLRQSSLSKFYNNTDSSYNLPRTRHRRHRQRASPSPIVVHSSVLGHEIATFGPVLDSSAASSDFSPRSWYPLRIAGLSMLLVVAILYPTLIRLARRRSKHLQPSSSEKKDTDHKSDLNHDRQVKPVSVRGGRSSGPDQQRTDGFDESTGSFHLESPQGVESLLQRSIIIVPRSFSEADVAALSKPMEKDSPGRIQENSSTNNINLRKQRKSGRDIHTFTPVISPQLYSDDDDDGRIIIQIPYMLDLPSGANAATWSPEAQMDQEASHYHGLSFPFERSATSDLDLVSASRTLDLNIERTPSIIPDQSVASSPSCIGGQAHILSSQIPTEGSVYVLAASCSNLGDLQTTPSMTNGPCVVNQGSSCSDSKRKGLHIDTLGLASSSGTLSHLQTDRSVRQLKSASPTFDLTNAKSRSYDFDKISSTSPESSEERKLYVMAASRSNLGDLQATPSITNGPFTANQGRSRSDTKRSLHKDTLTSGSSFLSHLQTTRSGRRLKSASRTFDLTSSRSCSRDCDGIPLASPGSPEQRNLYVLAASRSSLRDFETTPLANSERDISSRPSNRKDKYDCTPSTETSSLAMSRYSSMSDESPGLLMNDAFPMYTEGDDRSVDEGHTGGFYRRRVAHSFSIKSASSSRSHDNQLNTTQSLDEQLVSHIPSDLYKHYRFRRTDKGAASLARSTLSTSTRGSIRDPPGMSHSTDDDDDLIVRTMVSAQSGTGLDLLSHSSVNSVISRIAGSNNTVVSLQCTEDGGVDACLESLSFPSTLEKPTSTEVSTDSNDDDDVDR